MRILCLSDCLDISIHFHFVIFSLITCSSFCPSTSSSRMWWTNPLCNSAEDLDKLAENEPPTGYEPNEYHITEAYVEYTQESSGEQRIPDDFDYDDVTIGRERASHKRRHSRTESVPRPVTLQTQRHFERKSLAECSDLSIQTEITPRTLDEMNIAWKEREAIPTTSRLAPSLKWSPLARWRGFCAFFRRCAPPRP